MATKTFTIESIGEVAVVKRRGNRNLRLTISADGKVRVSIPSWAPYRAGIDFATSRRDWIYSQLPKETLLKDGQAIGRAHHLKLSAEPELDKPKALLKENQIIINYPASLEPYNELVQRAAILASTRALRKQAESLLPQRLNILSTQHSLPVKDVKIKQLSRRWGSCDQNKSVVLNLFLIQLPWELIDYVILHELTHTKHLDHGPEFWHALESLAPNARQLKKELNRYHPGIITSLSSTE